MHITTDMLIDLYHTRSQQLQDARTQMRNYRRGLKQLPINAVFYDHIA